MNPNERFDELFRRKLDVPAEGPVEHDWALMRQQLAAAKAHRRRRAGFLLMAMVLLVGVAGWSLWRSDRGRAGTVTSSAERTRTEVLKMSPAIEGSEPKQQEGTSGRSVPVQGADRSVQTPIDGSAVERGGEGSSSGSAMSMNNATVPGVKRIGSTAAATTGSGARPAPAVSRDPARHDGIPSSVVTDAGHSPGLRPEQDATAHEAGMERHVDVNEEMPVLDRATNEEPPVIMDQVATTIEPIGQDLSEPVSGSADAMHEEHGKEEPDPRNAIMPDSATAALQDLQVIEPAPSLPQRPWEVTLTAGALFSATRYTGPSHDWTSGSTGLWSGAYGVEAMRIGRHFGVGLGLHATSYREQLAVQAKDRQGTELITTYSLGSVDTTVLVITDSLSQGGQTYYIGQPQTTTIFFLQSDTDTLHYTERVRPARVLEQHMGYLEIPLLLDVHGGRGRWMFGLRGGPTLGILTGRRVEFPVGPEGAYLEPGSEAFRRVLPGYMLRAYTRFRWAPGWSVGIEPMLRGQFMDGLTLPGSGRRNSAWGGVVSVVHHLR